MWQLRSEKEDEEFSVHFHVLADEEFQVGRKACDILIVKDASVSRKHASLTLCHPACNVGNVKNKSVCMLKDCGSKYGTFVNGTQVESQGVELKHNDLITFGQCGSNYRVYFEPVVVTTSCLDAAEKSTFKEIVRKLGGHVIDEWNTNCTHLVMSKIKVTVKTVCALLSNKPIVSTAYFKMLLDSCKAKTQPKNSNKFLPPVEEVLFNQESTIFLRNPERGQLFNNNTFIFLTAHQYMKLRLPVTLGGGKAVLINRSRCDVTPALLLSSSVIQYPAESGKSESSQSQSQTCSSKEIDDIKTLLRESNKRFIPESDIGLAVVYCSVKQYCNPDYMFESCQSASTCGKSFKLQSQTLSQNFVYVPETQQSTASNKRSGSPSSTAIEIPPTFRSSPESSILTDKENVEQPLPAPKKKRSASSESREKPSSKVFKIEEPFESDSHASVGLGSFDLEGNTQPFPGNLNDNPSCQIVEGSLVSSKKRPLTCANLLAERCPRSQDADSPTKTLQSRQIKAEAPSPQPSEEIFDDNFEQHPDYNADTEPATENVLKTETLETLPLKRQRLDSDSVQDCKETRQPSVSSVGVSSRVPQSSGYLGLKKSQKTSDEVTNNEASHKEEDIPNHLLVVKLADLVVSRRPPTRRLQNETSNVKNFKKFKKAAYCGANSLPRIIGGNDLVVHMSKENLNEIKEFLLQETEHTQPSLESSNTSFRARFAKSTKTVI